MPARNPPWAIGDDIYQQFDLRVDLPIASTQAVTKGHLYTVDADGYLTALTATGDVAQVGNGVVQAVDNVAAKTYTAATSGGYPDANAPRVQCLTNRCFIVLGAPANLVRESRVRIDAAGTTITNGVCKAVDASAALPVDYLGVVHDILTETETNNIPENKKAKTEAGDLVVIRRGLI